MRSKLFAAAAAVLIVLSCVAGCVMGLRSFSQEDARAPEHLSALSAQVANRLDVEVNVVNVDPLHGSMKVALVFHPRGDLLVPGTREPARDIELSTDAAQGPQTLTLHRHRVPHAAEVTLDLVSGDISLYPLDRYAAVLELAAHGSGGDDAVAIPLQVEFRSHQHTFHVDAQRDPASTANELALRLDLQRPAVARSFAWFMNTLMVIIAISAFIVAFNVGFRHKKPEANLLVWMSALLFVLPAFRNMLPGSPPLGTLSDYVVFFWVEGVVALCLLLMVVAWVRRGVVG